MSLSRPFRPTSTSARSALRLLWRVGLAACPWLATACDPKPKVDVTPAANAKGSGGQKGVIGVEAIARFDALSAEEKERIRSAKVFFGHQSVGENMLDGTARLGFEFRQAGSAADYVAPRLGHGYIEKNGEPLLKIKSFESFLGNIGDVDIAAMKLCWIDFEPHIDVGAVQRAYVAAMNDLITKHPRTRFIHITPPLTTNVPNLNRARLAFGDWLKSTYQSVDLVFDLGVVVSTKPDGSACENGGFRMLCPDLASDSGHLNPAGQERAAKAFLYAIYASL